MPADAATELLQLSRQLLDAIGRQDWAGYQQLCAADITAFEAEARGHLVAGLDFHRYYFELPAGGPPSPRQSTICSPHVRMLGPDAAVVSYIRLTQKISPSEGPVTVECEETRVWQRINGAWKHVHFHRSTNP